MLSTTFVNYLKFFLAGPKGIEPLPSVSKTEMISISPKAQKISGPAYRNRTHIRGVEDLCIIHYTNTGKNNYTTVFKECQIHLVLKQGIEP